MYYVNGKGRKDIYYFILQTRPPFSFEVSHAEEAKALHLLQDKIVEVQDVLMPTGIHKLIQYYLEGDRKVIKALQGSIGIVVSVLLVLLLLLGCLIMSFFLAAQIQQETMAVVEMGNTLAQEMTASYPQFKS